MIGRVVLLGTLALAGCGAIDNTPPIDEEIVGTWVMETFTVDGEPAQVEEGVNTARAPFVVFEAAMSGEGGCNDFASLEATGLFYLGGKLQPGEVFQTAAACEPEDLMTAERALMGMLSSQIEIDVAIEGMTMRWDLFGETITWSATETTSSGTPTP